MSGKDGRDAPELAAYADRLRAIETVSDDALADAINTADAVVGALDEMLNATSTGDDYDAVAALLDVAEGVLAELQERHARRLAPMSVRVRTDSCDVRRGCLVRRRQREERVLRRHGLGQRHGRLVRPRTARSRGAGRPRVRRCGSGSRTASADPGGDGDGPAPTPRRAAGFRLTFAVLTPEQRGEGWSR